VQFLLLDGRLERQQGAQLRVAILLDHEDRLVHGQEFLDFGAERKAAHPQVIDRDARAA
jgi:hypothetical protein